MKQQTRLTVEALEHRWCPAITASLRSGTLTISGTADNGTLNIRQDTTTAGTIQVLDGDTAVTGSPFTGVRNIRLNLTAADDTVAVDLGGLTFTGSLAANLGNGANTLTVNNGGLGSRLSVRAGGGEDRVTLGNGTDDLTLRDVDLALFGGIDNVTVSDGASITRALTTQYANDVTLAAGSTTHHVFLRGGTGGNTIEVAGDVTGDLRIDTYFRTGSSDATSVNISGEVDGGVFFSGSDQNDTFTLFGNVGRGVHALTHGGADKVSLGGAVTGSLSLDTGTGDDQVTVSGTVGERTSVSTGAGNDTFTLAATAQLTGRASVTLGAGTDTATVDDAATIATLLLNGGSGTDTFNGTRTRTGLTLVSF